MVSELKLPAATTEGAFRSLRLKNQTHPCSAITHSGVAAFRVAPLIDLKGEVFLSQLNLTEVTKVDNKWDT